MRDHSCCLLTSTGGWRCPHRFLPRRSGCPRRLVPCRGAGALEVWPSDSASERPGLLLDVRLLGPRPAVTYTHGDLAVCWSRCRGPPAPDSSTPAQHPQGQATALPRQLRRRGAPTCSQRQSCRRDHPGRRHCPQSVGSGIRLASSRGSHRPAELSCLS